MIVACVRAVEGDYEGAGVALALGLTALGLDGVITTLVTKLKEILPPFVDLEAIVKKLLEYLAREEVRAGERSLAAEIRSEAEPGTTLGCILCPVEGTAVVEGGEVSVIPDASEPYEAIRATVVIRLDRGIKARVEHGERVEPGRVLATYPAKVVHV